MSGDKAYRFSQNEFLVMLLLAGGSRCAVGLSDEKVNRDGLARAMTELFAGGWIGRNGDMLAPKGEGQLFYEISTCVYTAVLRSYSHGGRMTVCYVLPGAVWVCELMADGYRLKRMAASHMGQWLQDTGLLEPPVFSEEDVRKLEALSDRDAESEEKERLLSLERYKNSVELTEKYEFFRSGGLPHIRHICGDAEETCIYTGECLARMLEDVFSIPKMDGGTV